VTRPAEGVAYLSGPMTGLPDFNFPAFAQAAQRVRAAGWAVLNPAESFGGCTTLSRETYMRLDVQLVLLADVVVTLPGWDASSGARLEVAIAEAVGTPVVDLDGFLGQVTS
jgi:hypothetical protein